MCFGTHLNELLTIKNKGRKANDGYTFIIHCPERETETQSETRFQMFDGFCLFICLFWDNSLFLLCHCYICPVVSDHNVLERKNQEKIHSACRDLQVSFSLIQ